MIYSTVRLLAVLIFLFSSNMYSDIFYKDLEHINPMIQKSKTALLHTNKSDTTQYISLYDDIAELTITKNELLLKMDRVDDIDTDKTCELALDYGEIEFIKTQYYKTPFHDEVAKTLENIVSLLEQCNPPMAEQYLRPLLDIKENIYGKESAEVAKSHDALGNYYRIYMANFKKAIKEYEDAKSIREKLYGVSDPRITENYERLALSLYYYGDKMNRAEKLLLDSMNIRKSALNKEFSLFSAYMDLGIHYSMKDEYGKSILYLHKALKLFKGKVNIDYIVIVSELSQIYLNQDDLPNASKYGEEAFRVSKEFYGTDKHYHVLENSLRLTEINNRMNQEKAKGSK